MLNGDITCVTQSTTCAHFASPSLNGPSVTLPLTMSEVSVVESVLPDLRWHPFGRHELRYRTCELTTCGTFAGSTLIGCTSNFGRGASALADETAKNKTAAPARTRMDAVFIAEQPVPTRGNVSNDDGGA